MTAPGTTEPAVGQEAPEPPAPQPLSLSAALQDRKRWILLLVVALVWVVLDQVSKAWAHGTLQFLPGRVIHLVDGFAAFSYVRNPGAAWGFLSSADSAFRLPFFIVVTSVAMVFMLYIFIRLEPGQWLLMLALSCILGGAIGNFIDRIRFNYVVDFILLHYQMRWRWPTFNVADVAITVGVTLMLGEMILGPLFSNPAAVAEVETDPLSGTEASDAIPGQTPDKES